MSVLDADQMMSRSQKLDFEIKRSKWNALNFFIENKLEMNNEKSKGLYVFK